MSKSFEISTLENKRLTKDHYLLTVHPLSKIERPEPGQFFMLSVDNRLDPLLRRPFSIHRWLGGDLQFLYRVVGKGTKILKEKKPGDVLGLMGPFGRGFPLEGIQDRKIILVAGGLGMAPLFALAEAIAEKGPILLYGAKTKDELVCLDGLKSIGITPVVSTDDGSSGEKGTVVDSLYRLLKSAPLSPDSYLVYACGPKPMLKALSSLTREYKLKGYMALEEHMACGVGACMGCVVNTRAGYKCVCREGPVFPVDEIIW